jgi:hypothetical protein
VIQPYCLRLDPWYSLTHSMFVSFLVGLSGDGCDQGRQVAGAATYAHLHARGTSIISLCIGGANGALFIWQHSLRHTHIIRWTHLSYADILVWC